MEVNIKVDQEKEILFKLEKFENTFPTKFKPSTSLLDMQKKIEKAVKQKE